MESGSITYLPEPPREELLPSPTPRGPSRRNMAVAVAAIVIVAAIAYIRFDAPPADFPSDTILRIEKGDTLSEVARSLGREGAIRSEFAFKSLLVLFGGTRGVQAGDYYLESPESAATIAWRLSHSLYELKNIRVTIPEGLNVKEIAAVFAKQKKFTHFNMQEFLKIASPYEGYLFPDTYLLLPNVAAQDIVDV
ncbi:endolytic transglycosylase MltG, partial [Candidatus Parcubacteria bacterium]|nr:endolytic transglycosylase MltG [Candidatus Parcubacteria bacterium]